jgi:protein SCO1
MKSFAIITLALAIISSVARAQQSDRFPQDSIYQLTSNWQLQTGQQIPLAQLAGKTQVVAFVYSHCTSICPVIVEDLKKIEKKLSSSAKQNTQFLLVTLDPQADTSLARQSFMRQHKLDNKHWHFIGSKDADTRELAMLLNIRYRREGDEIVHSNLVTVVNGDGKLIFQGTAAKDMEQLVRIISQKP